MQAGAPDSQTAEMRALAAREDRWRYSPVGLLGALILLLLVTPFVHDLPQGDLIEAGLLTLVLVSAVLSAGARARTMTVAVLLAVPALAGKWVNHFRPDLMPKEVFLWSGMIFMLFVVGNLFGYILRMPRVDAGVFCAGISAYLMPLPSTLGRRQSEP
jgi:hypothetical protein